MPQDKFPEPGEFTRIFKRQHLGSQAAADAEKKAGEISGIHPAVDLPPAQPEPPLGPAKPTNPPLFATNPAPGSNEPGEFTQYFMGGLPAKASSANPNSTQRVPPGVQRPNTPINSSRNLNGDCGSSSGSFSERFAPRSDAPARRDEKSDDSAIRNPWAAQSPELNKPWQARDEHEQFDLKPPLPPTSSTKDEPGEYTAIFGRGNVPPPPRQSAVTPPPLAPMMNDSPNRSVGGDAPSSRTVHDFRATPQPPKGPSEWTVLSQGRPGIGGVSAEPPSPGGSSPSPGAAQIPVGVNFTPPNFNSMIPGAGGSLHMPAMSGSASASGASVSSPLGGANLHAPAMPPVGVPQIKPPAGGSSRFSDQTKLILFFGVLAILAVILIVVLAAMQKN